MKNNCHNNLYSLIIKAFLDVIFPPVCWICENLLEADRKVVCVNCFNAIEKFGENTDEFDDKVFLFDRVYILFEFDDILRKLVHMIKYQNCRSLACYFAQAAFEQLNIHSNKTYAQIIPVPLHPLRLRERGYNQSGEIVRYLSTIMSLPHNNNPLSRLRHTQTQTQLSKQQRVSNISGAFYCNQDLSGQHVLVLDDVITTGSTVNECSRALLQAGAASVDVLALANPRLGE
jgi:competence protein ComFC